jgi:tyrosyl-tRNA synthetase
VDLELGIWSFPKRDVTLVFGAMSILEELEWRGLIADCTDKAELAKRTAAPLTLYCGFDPTADSLHVGNLVPLLALRRFQLLGHHPIALAGGATGSIGDPSGKTQERQLLTKEVLDHNIAQVKEQLKRLLDFEIGTNPARLLDNATWTAPVSYLEFLRDIGKHFSVNQMVAKESVRARMEDREAGISYTEFSYMLLQAFDFYVQCRDLNCELQIGGSDQWGNITAGIDLTRKKLGRAVYGLTLPLITNSDGSKFGKTAAGAIWLDPKKTSVYRFYQFWINTDDRDVVRYLKYFTFLSPEKIAQAEQKMREWPEERMAQTELANEVTKMIHGEDAALAAFRASQILFGAIAGKISEENISQDALECIVGEVPTREIVRGTFEGEGIKLVELLNITGSCASKSEARQKIQEGGAYINNDRETNIQRSVTTKDLLFGKHLLLRKGKKNFTAVTVK